MHKFVKVVLIALIFSTAILIGCKKNKPPEIPSIPSGPSSGSINIDYTFTSSAEDPEEDSVAIRFDWGDGDISNWSSWKANGDSVSMSHAWSAHDSYYVKAQARNKMYATSEWSAGHQIMISRGWIKTFGGSSEDYGYSVQQTSDGGYIISGTTSSYSVGETDVYLIKTDGCGNQLWSKTFGGSNRDEGYSVEQTQDDGYIITGTTSSYGAGYEDVYLVKIDASGNQLWYKTFGGFSYDDGSSVQQTWDGGYIIAGSTSSSGAGETDIYLIKTDASGNQQWYKTFGGSSYDYGSSVQQTSDSGYIITGVTVSYGAGWSDVYLIKTDGNGNEQWSKTFGGLSADWGYSVQQTSDGGYITTGLTMSFDAGSWDVYLVKTDASGNEQWYKTFGVSDGAWGQSVQQTSDGGYIITGMTLSYGAGLTDVYLIKTDANGNQLWYKKYGGSSEDYGYSVRQTSDGGYIITGSTGSFGAGLTDVYLIKIDANGNME